METIGNYVLLAAVIAGITELIKRLRARDYWAVLTILTAVVTGALFGFFHYYPGLDMVEGIAVGFGATGAVAALATRSTPAPSDAVQGK